MKRTKNFQSKVRANTVEGGIPAGANFPYVVIRAKWDKKGLKMAILGPKVFQMS